MGIAYRLDIDGLRAIAVLSVIIYHVGLGFQFDGFVGVDIFFVISGFLITGIIYKEIEKGHYSFISFYVRRIKRIIPVFFATLLVTTLVGMMIMLPEDIKSLGKSAFSGVLSAANIYFWYSEDSSYFAQSSDLIPLLHTWSLGVEEQFYMVWPILLLITYRLFSYKGVLALCIAITIGSYAYAEHLLGVDASFSYYMLPPRAGELSIGALAFILDYKFRLKANRSICEAVSVLGLLLVVYSLFFADAKPSFPGIDAIYPCLGTALIIYGGANRNTALFRVLSLRPMVFIGMISYSLYLWHWPVLSFTRYLFTTLTPGMIAACLVTTFVLSILSYHYIEVPFRRKTITPKFAFGGYFVVPASILATLALFLYKSNGMYDQITSNPAYCKVLQERDSYTKPAYEYDYVCQTDEHPKGSFSDDTCVKGSEGAKPSILLWGDSHAAHHVGFFAEVLKESGYAFRNLEVGGCPPVFRPSIEYGTVLHRVECREFRKKIEQRIDDYPYIFIGAPWDQYREENGKIIEDLRATVAYLASKNKKVLLLGQIPIFKHYDRSCLLKNQRMISIDCKVNARHDISVDLPANRILRTIAESYDNVAYFNMSEYICDPNCSPYRDGNPLYFDTGHISIYGSRLMGRKFLHQNHQAASEILDKLMQE